LRGDDENGGPGVIIPSCPYGRWLLRYLADLWHESAGPDRQTVRWVRWPRVGPIPAARCC